MEFRILGPVEVVHGGEPVRLDGPRQERVLAMLLINRGRLVTIEALVDVVWPSNPPVTATNQVQNSVTALRRKLCGLGMPESGLVRKGAGYLLTIPDDQFDAAHYLALIRQGRLLARSGNTARAIRTLRRAEDLWCGPALAGLPGDALAFQSEAVRLEEIRLQALEERLVLEVNLGRHHECLAELAGLARGYPLREGLQGALMLALHRCGRSAEALEVYDRAQRRLAEEFGLEPSAGLRRLRQLVLSERQCSSLAGFLPA
ncbi:AfsR/SARP family transcriptional regulator [Planosporangium sp. 12N6]|uniref:AfsR/SARP family transcriptional regulator n=1 Tax=Planosporangium spinosum TaxID=3402278 RepID=UPI003CEC0919